MGLIVSYVLTAKPIAEDDLQDHLDLLNGLYSLKKVDSIPSRKDSLVVHMGKGDAKLPLSKLVKAVDKLMPIHAVTHVTCGFDYYEVVENRKTDALHDIADTPIQDIMHVRKVPEDEVVVYHNTHLNTLGQLDVLARTIINGEVYGVDGVLYASIADYIDPDKFIMGDLKDNGAVDEYNRRVALWDQYLLDLEDRLKDLAAKGYVVNQICTKV